MEKILIANRGESACRIIKTAKKMGFGTVAVYSTADMNSKHIQIADEAFLLGDAISTDSYLNIDKIIKICKNAGVKYVHPGWGFLSENMKFAREIEKAGFIFIGPSSDSMKKMGDKIRSKKIAEKVGVNVVPGDTSILENVTMAKKIAKKLGYPIMLKASAGGGGKGIRIVFKEEELSKAFDSVRNEAKNSFGDSRIFMEKYVKNPRHIEIQVIGDKYGNVLCLGERECSIQRNNQKIIEEAPSSFIDEKIRKKMYKQVLALCKEVGYYSAGTVEFMIDKDKNFYFLEMNTRLQVEHGVTELITGLDLVELMINVAKGEKLPFKQKDIKLDGWAMECRINAEDSKRGFLPSSGRIVKYIEPEKSPNVRIDTGVYEGYSVSMYYDSMIAKLLTYGKNRNEAIEKMKESLGSFYIEGISHNIPFLERIMYNEKFQKGDFDTGFIKQEFSNEIIESEIQHKEPLIGVALYMFNLNTLKSLSLQSSFIYKRKNTNKWVVDLNGEKILCTISYIDNVLNVTYGNDFIAVESSWKFGDNIFRGTINGVPINVKILNDNKVGNFKFQFMGSTFDITIRNPRTSELEKYMPKLDKTKKIENLKAPITGKIVKFFVNVGDEIQDGADIVVIEAMKMENIIKAEANVKIKKINFNVGDLVNKGDIIIEFE